MIKDIITGVIAVDIECRECEEDYQLMIKNFKPEDNKTQSICPYCETANDVAHYKIEEVNTEIQKFYGLKNTGAGLCDEMISEVIKADLKDDYRIKIDGSEGEIIKANSILCIVDDVERDGEKMDNGALYDINCKTGEEVGHLLLSLIDHTFESLSKTEGSCKAEHILGGLISQFIIENDKIHSEPFAESILEIAQDLNQGEEKELFGDVTEEEIDKLIDDMFDKLS